MSTLADKKGRRAHLQKQWHDLYSSKSDLKNWTADEAAQLKQWFDEANDLGVEIETLESLDVMAKGMSLATEKGVRIVDDPSDEPLPKTTVTAKSMRQYIEDSAEYKAFTRNGNQGTFQFHIPESDVKTLITLSDAAPQNVRLPRVEPYPVERRTVADLMAQGTIDRGTLEYYEETTFTNAAAETAEGSAKPEAALDWTLRTETVGKIPVWIPATAESLADISWLESTIRNRLVFMIERRKETQLLNGDGTSPNISGITDRSGLQTQAKGSDPVFDAILKAMTLIQVNSFYEPDAIVMHPNDWRDLLLTRTADGIYILGNPGDPTAARRLWGLEVRATTAQTENTAIVGAFGTAAQVFYRSGITVTASTEHASYFIENKVAILAEQRLALAVYRPNAFCTVTGI